MFIKILAVSLAAALVAAQGPLAYSELAQRGRAWDYGAEGAAELGNTTDAERAGAVDLTIVCEEEFEGRLALGNMWKKEPTLPVGVNATEAGEYLSDTNVRQAVDIVYEECRYTFPGDEGVTRAR